MELLRWIIGCVITAALAALAVMNSEFIDFHWSPLHEPLSIPVYAVLLFSVVFGFLFGSISTWLNMSSLRCEKRKQKTEIKHLKKEVEKLNKAQAAKAENINVNTQVALPAKILKNG